MKHAKAALFTAFISAFAATPARAEVFFSLLGGGFLQSGAASTGLKKSGFDYGGELTYAMPTLEIGLAVQKFELSADTATRYSIDESGGYRRS